jgi:hypothetical protein
MTEPQEPEVQQPEEISTVINCPRCGARHRQDEEHAEYVPLPMGPRTVRNILRQGRVIS